MRALSPDLIDALAAAGTTLAYCWKLTRLDGVILGFTSHDRSLVIEGVVYKAATGAVPTAVSSDLALSANNLEVRSIFDDEGILAKDLVGGRYDYARVLMFLVDYQALPATLDADPPNHIVLLDGLIGEVSATHQTATGELRSLLQRLSQGTSNLTSKTCRYTFGDAFCTRSLTDLTFSGQVLDVNSKRDFVVEWNDPAPTDPIDYGHVDWQTGSNTGFRNAVARHTTLTGRIELFELASFAIAVGDTFTAVAGCQKTERACMGYDNFDNFGGEPDIPGADAQLSGSVTR